MSNKTIIIIVVAISVLGVFYMLNQKYRLEQQTRLAEQQVAMINAQTNQQIACQESWICATTSLLTGAGDVLGGIF